MSFPPFLWIWWIIITALLFLRVIVRCITAANTIIIIFALLMVHSISIRWSCRSLTALSWSCCFFRELLTGCVCPTKSWPRPDACIPPKATELALLADRRAAQFTKLLDTPPAVTTFPSFGLTETWPFHGEPADPPPPVTFAVEPEPPPVAWPLAEEENTGGRTARPTSSCSFFHHHHRCFDVC